MLLLLLVFTSAKIGFARVQPMAIVPQKIIFHRTTSGGSIDGKRFGRAASYCLDKAAHQPQFENALSTFVTDPPVTYFKEGKGYECLLSQVPGLSIIGNGGYESIDIVEDGTVDSLTIHRLSVVREKAYNKMEDEFLREIASTVANETSHKSDQQEKVWLFPFVTRFNELIATDNELQASIASIKGGIDQIDKHLAFQSEKIGFDLTAKNGFVQMQKKNLLSTFVDIDHIDLYNGGSAVIFKDTSGKLIIIDGGKTKADAERLAGYLKLRFPNEIPRANIIFSHHDADHCNGILELLKSGYKFGEIIIPNTFSTSEDRANVRLSYLTDYLRSFGYRKQIIQDSQLVKFFPSKNSDIPLSIENEGSFSEKLNQYRVEVDANTNFTLYQLRAPRTVNEHSLVAKISHNGVSHLITGDIAMKNIRALIEGEVEARKLLKYFSASASFEDLKSAMITKWSYYGLDRDPLVLKEIATALNENISLTIDNINAFKQQSIQSTVLVWPHHHWLPKMTVTDRRNLDEFLDLVDPQVIVVTNPPSSQDFDELKSYLNSFVDRKKALKRVVDIVFLHDSGNTSIRAKEKRERKFQFY